jgi:DNA-binding CsgD family transcriptional regulator
MTNCELLRQRVCAEPPAADAAFERHGRLTADERRYMGEILSHMAKAMDLGRAAAQLRTEHQGLLAAMDRLIIGVCILDPKGGVVVHNEEFRRQVDTFPVMRIAPDGALRFTRADDQKRFAALKTDALNHGRFGARPRKEAVAAGADTFLCIEVAPLDRCEEIGARTFGGLILYSTDTSLPVHCNTRPIQMAFGLTDTELAVVDAIAEGLTNAQIAERRGRAVTTIDTQVKSILAKTQCATRTQFVRLMMGFGVDYVAPAAKNPRE